MWHWGPECRNSSKNGNRQKGKAMNRSRTREESDTSNNSNPSKDGGW